MEHNRRYIHELKKTITMMDIEKLKDEAAMFLEEMHVSGDVMVDMDHCLDELPEEKQGAYYLHDLMAIFFEKCSENQPHDRS